MRRFCSIGFIFASMMGPMAFGQNIIPRIEADADHAPGLGFDSQSREFRGACLAGRREFAGTPSAFLSFDRALEADDVKHHVEAQFSGGVNLVLVSGKVTTKLTSIMHKKTFSDTLVYLNSIRTRSEVFQPEALTPFGKEVAAFHDLNYSRVQCGNEFVKEIQRGADIFISIDFNFSDESIRNEFKTKVEFSILGIKKSKTFSRVSEEVDKNTYISIDAYQIGGNPRELEQVLASLDRQTCRLDEVDACNRIVDKLLDYATSPQGFPAQAANSILSYKTASYYASGFREIFFEPSPLFSAESRAAAERMSDLYLQETGHMQEAQRLLALPLKPEERRAIDYLERTLLPANLSELRKGIDHCGRFPLACMAKENEIQAKLRAYDPNTLRILRTFYHYCADPQAEIGVSKASRAIRDLTGTNDCLEAETRMAAKTDLNLPDMDLTHLKFLRGIQNLRRLNVQRNHLTSIGGMRGLGDLSYLDVSSNGITNINPVKDLDSLRVLRLQNNGIMDFSAVRNMESLTTVYAYGNPALNQDALNVLRGRGVKVLGLDEEACVSQGQEAVRLGLVTAFDWDMYKEIDFTPLFNPVSPGTVDWINCEAALPQLYHNYEGIKP